jgi:signal transduction histidine kinase
MKKDIRILHVEDDPSDAALIVRELRRGGYDPVYHRVDTQPGFRESLENQPWDIILSDHALPTYSGRTALMDLKASGKDIPFILVSGTIGEELAVQILKAGAQDYVLKDHLTRLPAAIEREIREAEGRIEQRRMREQMLISERMASAGALAAGVAHEINNPLAVIIANLDYISYVLAEVCQPKNERNGDLGAGQEALDDCISEIEAPLRDAREAAHRVKDIVRDVKIFSRPNPEQHGAVDIHRVIESSLRMAWNEVRHRARVVREFGEIPEVQGNESRLGQVVLNLIINAAQAIPEGRAEQNEIKISTAATSDGGVLLEVCDSGAGIPPAVIDRIFDPFFTTKPVGIGTGLGLAVCHRIVSSMGGQISVRSEPGKGSVFSVLLQRTTQELTHQPASAPVLTSSRRARILVVDDEEAIGRAIQRCIGHQHDVEVLCSGREALERFARGDRYDLVLSDIMMPEVTGIEMYEKMRTIAPDQLKSTVFLTGGAFTTAAQDFLEREKATTLDKPFDIATLLSTIEKMLQRAASEPKALVG